MSIFANDMKQIENRCLLWVGDKHSGKTTAATELVRRIQRNGYTVGGILAPSIYEQGCPVGFDIVDIKNDYRIPLAVRDERAPDIGCYRYDRKGLELGRSVLSLHKNRSSHLVIVDEYGPWELQGKGWRLDVDRLLTESCIPILLVVRRELADKVRQLYAEYGCFSLEAKDSRSIDKILLLLKEGGF